MVYSIVVNGGEIIESILWRSTAQISFGTHFINTEFAILHYQ
jgi:hypothetical protein